MYKSNVQRRMISLPEGKTLEDDLMFDSDCLAILLTALAADVCRERAVAGQLMREQGVRSLQGETEISFRSRSGSRSETLKFWCRLQAYSCRHTRSPN